MPAPDSSLPITPSYELAHFCEPPSPSTQALSLVIPTLTATMKLINVLAVLATAYCAVAQVGAGQDENTHGGLGLELCNRVQNEGMDCSTDRESLITALGTGGLILLDKASREGQGPGTPDYDKGMRMQQLAGDLRARG